MTDILRSRRARVVLRAEQLVLALLLVAAGVGCSAPSPTPSASRTPEPATLSDAAAAYQAAADEFNAGVDAVTEQLNSAGANVEAIAAAHRAESALAEKFAGRLERTPIPDSIKQPVAVLAKAARAAAEASAALAREPTSASLQDSYETAFAALSREAAIVRELLGLGPPGG